MDRNVLGCFLCLQQDDLTNCVNCANSFCRDHENLHYDPIHKTCYPFRVIQNDRVGKYVVAVR